MSRGGCAIPLEAARSYDDREERKNGAVYHSCSQERVMSPHSKKCLFSSWSGAGVVTGGGIEAMARVFEKNMARSTGG